MKSHDPIDNPEWKPEQLRNAIKAAGVALWSWNVDDDTFLMDAKGYELWDQLGPSYSRACHELAEVRGALCRNRHFGRLGERGRRVWTEQGGPEVDAPAASDGYGSRLLHRAVTGHLAGSIVYNWTRSGVLVTLRINEDRLAR